MLLEYFKSQYVVEILNAAFGVMAPVRRSSYWLFLGMLAQSSPSQALLTTLSNNPFALDPQYPPNVLFISSITAWHLALPYAQVSNTSSYVPTTRYQGYFDPGKCYNYVPVTKGGTEAAPTYTILSATVVDNVADSTHNFGWFDPLGTVDGSGLCTSSTAPFNGNFMNYATMSKLDLLRVVLTGGRRVRDDTTMTVLGRSHLGSNKPQGTAPNITTIESTPDTWATTMKTTDAMTDPAVPGLQPYIVITPSAYNAGAEATYTRVITAATDGLITSIPAAWNNQAVLMNQADMLYMGSATSSPKQKKFYVYVKACTDGPTDMSVRTDVLPYCKAYRSSASATTVYGKPEGTVQALGDFARIGTFSNHFFNIEQVLNNSTSYLWGGILHTPIKSIGSHELVPTPTVPPTLTANPEWDKTTGILAFDPDLWRGTNVAGGLRWWWTDLSGVVNFLSWGGSLAGGSTSYPSYPGRYPYRNYLGSMFYEALRYMKNENDYSANGIAGRLPLHNASWPTYRDSFNVQYDYNTTWVPDPILHQCQKNYFVAIGDNNLWYDEWLPGFSFTTTPATGYTQLTDASYPAGSTSTRMTKIVTLEGASSTPTHDNATFSTYGLPAFSYWAHTNDIRARTTVKQTIDSFFIDMGAYNEPTSLVNSRLGLAAKYGGFIDSNNSGDFEEASDQWKSVISTPNRWQEPYNYVSAQDPANFIKGLSRMFGAIQKPSATAGTGSSAQVTPDGKVFFTGYDASTWTGDLVMRQLSFDSKSSTFSMDASDNWSASKQLDSIVASNRTMITFVPGTGGIAFKGTTLSGTNLLGTTTPVASYFYSATGSVASDDGQAQNRISWLRGDRANEQPTGSLRARKHLLGDIVNSQPVYVGAPGYAGIAALAPDASYASFISSYKNRDPIVYVGANDGFVHGFVTQKGSKNAGAEAFAYAPGWTLPALTTLTAPTYSHRFFVDAPLTAADAKVSGAWKTVLVGGGGQGGRGVFALNITDPAQFTESAASSLAMWEFTNTNDPDLGLVTGKPVIVKMANGNYAAIVGNGLNAQDLVTNAGHIFIFFLEGPSAPATNTWTSGVNYVKISLPSEYKNTSGAATTYRNGVMGVSVLPNPQTGLAEYIYAGDVQGRLWRIDVRSSTPSDWSNPQKMTQLAQMTQDTAGLIPSPITSAPVLVQHPYGGVMVIVSTGQIVQPTDITDGRVHSILGVWDWELAKLKNSTTPAGNLPITYNSGLTDLPESTSQTLLFKWLATLTGSTGTQSVTAIFNDTGGAYAGQTLPTSPPWKIPGSTTNSGKEFYGWRLDLPGSGERALADLNLVNGKLTFTTVQNNFSSNVCQPSVRVFDYVLNPLTGGAMPMSLDSNRDGVLNSADAANVIGIERTNAVPSKLVWTTAVPRNGVTTDGVVGGLSGSASSADNSAQGVTVPIGGDVGIAVTTLGPRLIGLGAPASVRGRLSWRELLTQ